MPAGRVLADVKPHLNPLQPLRSLAQVLPPCLALLLVLTLYLTQDLKSDEKKRAVYKRPDIFFLHIKGKVLLKQDCGTFCSLVLYEQFRCRLLFLALKRKLILAARTWAPAVCPSSWNTLL